METRVLEVAVNGVYHSWRYKDDSSIAIDGLLHGDVIMIRYLGPVITIKANLKPRVKDWEQRQPRGRR